MQLLLTWAMSHKTKLLEIVMLNKTEGKAQGLWLTAGHIIWEKNIKSILTSDFNTA